MADEENETSPLMEKTLGNIKDTANATGDAIKTKVTNFVQLAKDGNASIRGLALIAGLATVISSIYEILDGIVNFQPTSTLIGLYSLIMGSIAVAMEVDPEALPYGAVIRNALLKYLGLVQLASGRGVFYFIAGTLELTQTEVSANIVGAFTALVGILYILVSYRAAKKVRHLREQKFSKSTLKNKFKDADEDGDGAINFEEFHKLLLSLDLDITFQGAELIYVSLDRDLHGHLSFEDFQSFWDENPLTLVPAEQAEAHKSRFSFFGA